MADVEKARFATELERELYEALAEVMAAFRTYAREKNFPMGMARITAAEKRADAALAKAAGTET